MYINFIMEEVNDVKKTKKSRKPKEQKEVKEMKPIKKKKAQKNKLIFPTREELIAKASFIINWD